MSRRKGRGKQGRSNGRYYLVGGALAAVIVGYLLVSGSLSGHKATSETTSSSTVSSTTTSTSTTSTSTGPKPVILYVNQGNGVVNESNFGALLSTATANGFNTIFFQVYRSGTLLFTTSDLDQFVAQAHGDGLKIFFALYFTASNQTIPASIYTDGEDGISLDMSTLSLAAQTTLFRDLATNYSGMTAITTDELTGYPLAPDLLVVETYAPGDQQYIHSGMIAGVEVVATSSLADYQQQVKYALANSDGVMVFDYDGLVKAGY